MVVDPTSPIDEIPVGDVGSTRLASSLYLFKYKFSKILDNTDRRLIGPYEAICVGSLPGLTIVIICEILNCLGQYDVRMIPLWEPSMETSHMLGIPVTR
jgi:hypothetical protein